MAPALGANPGENGVVVRDREAALLFRHMPGDQRYRHIDIDQEAASRAIDMIVTIDTGIVTARLVCEAELLNLAVPRQQVQRPVDGAVSDARIALAHPFENLTGREVRFRLLHDRENHRPLVRFPITLVCVHPHSNLVYRPPKRTS